MPYLTTFLFTQNGQIMISFADFSIACFFMLLGFSSRLLFHVSYFFRFHFLFFHVSLLFVLSCLYCFYLLFHVFLLDSPDFFVFFTCGSNKFRDFTNLNPNQNLKRCTNQLLEMHQLNSGNEPTRFWDFNNRVMEKWTNQVLEICNSQYQPDSGNVGQPSSGKNGIWNDNPFLVFSCFWGVIKCLEYSLSPKLSEEGGRITV